MNSLSKEAEELKKYYYQFDLEANTRSLVDEAVRLKNRLDKFQSLLNNDNNEWFTIISDRAGNISIICDKILLEARQTATAFRQIIDAVDIKLESQTEEGDVVDVLADL